MTEYEVNFIHCSEKEGTLNILGMDASRIHSS